MLNGANENSHDDTTEIQDGNTDQPADMAIKKPIYPLIVLEKSNPEQNTEKPRARGLSYSGRRSSTTTKLQIPTTTKIITTKRTKDHNDDHLSQVAGIKSDPQLIPEKEPEQPSRRSYDPTYKVAKSDPLSPTSNPIDTTTPSDKQSLTESRELTKKNIMLECQRRTEQLDEVQKRRDKRLAQEKEEKQKQEEEKRRELEKKQKKEQLIKNLTKSHIVPPSPAKQTIPWETAFNLTALSMLLGASIWSVPMVSKNLATIAIGYGYTSVAERIQADIGKRALCSPSILGCISICLNIKTPGILLLLFTTGISTGCSYKEGNIYPGLLGTAGVILYAASYSFLRSESEPKQNTSIRPS